MVNEKALELLKDKDFLLELGKAASAEEAQKIFKSKGTDITIEELLTLRAAVKQKSCT